MGTLKCHIKYLLNVTSFYNKTSKKIFIKNINNDINIYINKCTYIHRLLVSGRFKIVIILF